MTFSLTKILLLLGLFAGCMANQNKITERQKRADSIGSVIDSIYQAGLFSGTVLVADHMGVLYKNAVGFADRDASRPLEVNTPFYLASVSKQFTAAAIMLLHQDSLLSFDDPIMDYLDELPGNVYAKISIRHLLNHTSGIPDYYTFANPTPGFTNDDVYKVMQQIDSLNFQPGEQYQYSNSGYVLLSILVGKISGKTFSEFFGERIIDPLQLPRCTVKDEHASEIKDPAIGYNEDGSISDYEFYTTGGGGIYASAEDLYLWDRSLYTGEIVNPDLLKKEAWASGILNSGEKTNYGFGWRLNPDNPEIVRHGGELMGFRTHFFRDTKQRVAIIILSNSGYNDVDGLCDRIFSVLNSSETRQ